MPNPRIKSVIFDYGNTLVSSGSLTAAAVKVFGRESGHGIGQTIEEKIQRLYTPDQKIQPAWEAIWQDALAASGLSFSRQSVEDHLREFNRQGELYPDSKAILTQLKRQGLRIGLLSNVTGPAALFDEDLKRKGLHDLFDTIIWSSQIGYRKPAPEAFALTLQQLGSQPSNTLMIGDSEIADIQGAAKLGLKTLRVDHTPGNDSVADAQCSPAELSDAIQGLLKLTSTEVG